MMIDVQLRLTQLQQAVTAGGEYFTPGVSAKAKADLRLAYERMNVGDGFVVAALVGGTGSGKSSLFNHITRLEFAAVGEQRPTTQEVMACTWGGDSSQLLQVLDVAPHAQFHFESILTSGADDHDAIVLLDTPDYDSAHIEHSGQVARIIPLVDVLIWVLDPQKYADASIYHHLVTLGHERAQLEHENESAAPMIVVLNKIDTLPVPERAAVLADVRQKLDTLGFAQMPLFATSALTGEGVDQLDQALAQASADHSIWHRTALAQLDSVTRLLQTQVGDHEADTEGPFLEHLTETVAQAAGVSAAAEAISSAASTRAEKGVISVPTPQAPAPTLTVAVRDMWVAHVIAGLPEQWQVGVEKSVPTAERLRKHIAQALSSVSVPAPRSSRRWGWVLTGVGIAVAGVLGAVLGMPTFELWVRLLVGGAGTVAGIALAVLGSWYAQRAAHRASEAAAIAYQRAVRAALAQELEKSLVPGPEAILKRHRAARTLLAA
ncbi:MAG: 50S ribosome-binding GTPase [Arcanobacterium sp.]|nr:50S ribosome-binding GTPase [Arcanobacterium sp.]